MCLICILFSEEWCFVVLLFLNKLSYHKKKYLDVKSHFFIKVQSLGCIILSEVKICTCAHVCRNTLMSVINSPPCVFLFIQCCNCCDQLLFEQSVQCSNHDLISHILLFWGGNYSRLQGQILSQLICTISWLNEVLENIPCTVRLVVKVLNYLNIVVFAQFF